ncbi:Lrp/AsnC family transcriptional regulator [Candidatus Hodarchaeum mangrovi]
MKFDTIDTQDTTIIRLLSKDGKTTYQEIASLLNFSPQTISDRVDKLVKKGIIKRFTIEVDPETIGYEIEFICELDIDASVMEEVLEVLQKIPEIHMIRITTGIHDILCIGNASSIQNLHDVVEKKISTIKGVRKTYTSITLRKVKTSQVMNLV